MNNNELHPAIQNIIKLLAKQAVDEFLSKNEQKTEKDIKDFPKFGETPNADEQSSRLKQKR